MLTAKNRRPRILAIASGGGHWVQLQRMRAAFDGCEVAFASVYPDYGDDLPGYRYHVVADVTRKSLPQLFRLVPQLVVIMLRERPDVVITTGAMPGLLALAVARVCTRARTIWIDSIANVERMSTSGRQAKYVAHAWVSQWPEVAAAEGAEYWGAVL